MFTRRMMPWKPEATQNEVPNLERALQPLRVTDSNLGHISALNPVGLVEPGLIEVTEIDEPVAEVEIDTEEEPADRLAVAARTEAVEDRQDEGETAINQVMKPSQRGSARERGYLSVGGALWGRATPTQQPDVSARATRPRRAIDWDQEKSEQTSEPDKAASTSTASSHYAEVVSWPEVFSLRQEVAKRIAELSHQWAVDHGVPMPEMDRRLLGRSVIRETVRSHAEQLSNSGTAWWTRETEHFYALALEDAIFGYGRMQPLFDIEDAENIEIHGWDCVTVQYADGCRESFPPVAESDQELVQQIRFLAENADPPRPFDDAHPIVTVALGAKFRLHAIGFGLADRPSVVIRQHLLTDVSLTDLAQRKMMPERVAKLLRSAVVGRHSMVISGDQGAGKTTLLRALIDAIPETERFGTLETDYELLTHLQPQRRNMVALQARVGMGEAIAGRRLGDFTVADLLPEALRQNLSRLIVGEVRGDEAGAMFEAMQAGAGTLSTTHSHSASSTIDRLAGRVAQGRVMTMEEAYRQIAHNISLLIHVRLRDNTYCGGARVRFISEIRALTGAIESGRPVTHLVYQADDDGELAFFDPAWSHGGRS